MSLLPYLFDYDHPRWPRRLLDQNFGLTLSPEDVTSAANLNSPLISRLKPWWPDAGSSIKTEKDKFQINVDVQHFSPDEITVKTSDGFIVIEGKHEEKKDEHGFVSRQFSRRFKLPEDINVDAVQSRLSSDGVLTVVAPKKTAVAKGERIVPITPTGPIRQLVDETKSEVVS
ncbi:protein lethal(2)essential for life-like [Plodia interpunctella]|uniref:protein lethal(2)essential for life-like n=1 Tax=Plodia interpunctella TaxID=58824 RepID=UPI002367B698|nr:protein lethal(2)essential for life-like [Plodia interpunctella]